MHRHLRMVAQHGRAHRQVPALGMVRLVRQVQELLGAWLERNEVSQSAI